MVCKYNHIWCNDGDGSLRVGHTTYVNISARQHYWNLLNFSPIRRIGFEQICNLSAKRNIRNSARQRAILIAT